MIRYAMVGAATCLAMSPLLAQADPAFDAKRLSRHIEILASDAFEGRGPATPGETKTVDYLVKEFAAAGLQPGGDLKDGKLAMQPKVVPGCQTPASWCDAHQLRHWVDGGPTDLGNAALLCGRHHTIVHRDRLTATQLFDHADAHLGPHIVWDRRPGSYDRALVDGASTGTGGPDP